MQKKIFLLSSGGFDPPPPTFCWLARFHYASMTFTSSCGFDPHPPTVVGTLPLRFNDFVYMCPFAKCFSIAHIRHRLHCVHLPIYHRVVSINRPSGYGPDALPLRHDDFYTPHSPFGLFHRV